MRYDVLFIVAALLCLLIGEVFGIWMSQDEARFMLSPAHAHLNLAGWATLALYGLMHRAYPALASSRLALIQFLAAALGAFVLAAGILIVIQTQQESVAIAGALLVVTGTLLFAIMFVRKVALAKALPA
jgi:hypothetical protein